MNCVAGEAQPGRPWETRMSPNLDSKHAGDGAPIHEPDEVMDLLAQVESQFDRIRSLRRTQDDAVRSLTSRNEELDEAETRLHQRETELQDEYAQRDLARSDELDTHLEALRTASDVVARRGRRMRELEVWMQGAQKDRHRLRRRLMGVHQAVRRLLRERDEWKTRHESLAESTEGDKETVRQQHQRLSIATSKIREFSKMLQEQTERLEEGAAAMVEADELRTRVRRLETELTSARTERMVVEQSPAPSPAPSTAAAPDAAPDEHLLRRRGRLQRCRQLIKEQARRLPQVAQLEAARRRQETQLMEQQQHLDEVRRVLTASEERMIHKWAASRSVQVTGWVVLLALLIGAGSWWAADKFDPPSMRSMVVINAAVPEGMTVEPEAMTAWKNWHTNLVTSEGFPEKLARRYTEQTGVAIDPVLVQRRIEEFVETGGDESDSMQFSMIGKNHDGTRDWLDAFARTLVSESARTARSRPNPILAQVRNRYMEGGHQRLARSDGQPIDDTRLRTSLLIFFLSIIACLVIGAIVFAHLSSTGRLINGLDEELADSGALLSD